MEVSIIEHSFFARFAAWKLRSNRCAIVFGKTIHLWGVSKADFVSNIAWLRHEVAHVYQWRKNTYFLFPILYVWYSIWHGYSNNPYEIEARSAEENQSILENVTIV